MDAGLQARTKQLIEFGLEVSFSPCKLTNLEYQQVTSHRTLAFEQLCSAMQKSMKHNTAVERQLMILRL